MLESNFEEADGLGISSRTNVLTFYSSQNVLCWSKFFQPAKNLIAFRASSKTFVQAQKPNLLNGNHLLVRHKFFWDSHKIFISIFGLAQNIWTSPKYFGTCRRTKHKYLNGGKVIDTKL